MGVNTLLFNWSKNLATDFSLDGCVQTTNRWHYFTYY